MHLAFMMVPVFDVATYVTILLSDGATVDEWSLAGYVALGNAGLKLLGITFYYLLDLRVNLAWVDVLASGALGYFTFAA